MEDRHHPLDGTDCRHTLVMGKLKDSLLLKLAAFNPSISINSNHASFIEHRLLELFNSFHTPTHPPYALMIERAIMELNEESGSTEEAISEFIRREYKDLPWAHVSILDLHLRKLCQDGELVCAKNGRYMLLVDYGRIGDGGETECEGSKKRKRGKKRRCDGYRERIRTLESCEGIERDNGLQDQELKEPIQVLRGDGTNDPSGGVELDEWTEEHGEAHQQSSERVEELGKSEEQLLEVVELEQQCQSEWQGTEVTEEHTEVEKYQGRMAHAQSEAAEPQIQEEAIMEFNDKIVSSKVMNKEPYQTNAQQDQIIGKHIQDEGKRQVLEDHYSSEEQPNGVHDELNDLCDQQTEVIQEQNTEALIENQKHIQQIEVTTEMSGFGSHVKTSDFNLSASHGGPTTAVIPEGNLAGIVSLMQLQLQMSCHGPSATELVAEPKMTDSLSSVDVYGHKQEQHLNLGSPKCKLDENPMSRNPEQLPPKNRRRGRPPKSKPVEDYPGKSLLPSDDRELKQPQHWNQGSPQRKLCENTTFGDLDQPPLKRRCRGRPPNPKPVTNNPGESLLPSADHELKQPQHWNQGSTKRKLCESTTFGDLDQPPLKRQCRGRPPNPKPVTDNPGKSLLPSDDGILNEQKENIFKIEQQQQPQPHGRGRGRGRPPKLHSNAHQCKEQLQPQDQSQGLVSSPYSEPKETFYSSQTTVLNHPVNLNLNSEQKLVVPISEGSPECTIKTGIELSPSDIDLCTTMEASSSSLNFHYHKKPQHWNQGSPKGKLDENPTPGDPAQKPPKHPGRGRPPKLTIVADNHPGVSLLPSDDNILNKQKPIINKMEEQQQHGRGRGRGRPPKLNRNANQCEEQLQPQDQAQGLGLERPPNPLSDVNQSHQEL